MAGPQQNPRRGSIRRDILELLADGRPRTATEVLRHIAASLDDRVRNTLYDLTSERLIVNHRRSPEEGLYQLNSGDELRRPAPIDLPPKPRAWYEL